MALVPAAGDIRDEALCRIPLRKIDPFCCKEPGNSIDEPCSDQLLIRVLVEQHTQLR
jgi:hypothetical protein